MPKNPAPNYRPIAIACICSKLLEHILYTLMVSYIESNHFFSKFQHVFRSGLSITMHLIEFVHDLSLSLDKNIKVDCLFLDFEKHSMRDLSHFLCANLLFLGLPEYILGWIHIFFFISTVNNEQSVVVRILRMLM